MKNTIIVILSILVIGLGSFLIFDKVIDKKIDNDTNEKNTNTEQDDNKEDNIQVSNDDIKLKSLNIEKYIVDDNGVNTKISVTGKIDLEFDENKYEGVTLSGYCLDANDTKYIITGPSDGRTLYPSGSSDLSLSEDLASNVIYNDGTTKSIREINWKDVSLKTCKLEKINGFEKTNDNTEQESNNENIVGKLKGALTNSDWVNNNLFARENCFGQNVEKENQKLRFEVLHDNAGKPIVVVLDYSEEDFVIACYKVYIENNTVVVKNVIGLVGHPSHIAFSVDKNQGLVIYNYAHMGAYAFRAYDIKNSEISIYDEYNCETDICEYEYEGNKTYNLSNISLELNKENIEKYVK